MLQILFMLVITHQVLHGLLRIKHASALLSALKYCSPTTFPPISTSVATQDRGKSKVIS
ncbi:hypothetical protein Syun_004116 [Stephania yunnanensis]|uniref:Uncharacterized protein n=1 Tax=Stephania yunnanensis TaxID=152371 RepID=A0AAP0L6K2_9MAGN